MKKVMVFALAGFTAAAGFCPTASAQMGRSWLIDKTQTYGGNPADGCGFTPSLGRSVESVATGLRTLVQRSGVSSEGRACSYYELGTLYAFTGDQGAAIANYEKALEWNAVYADAYEGEGDAYTAMAKPELAAQAYAKAKTVGQDPWHALADRCWVRAVRGAALERAAANCTAVLAVRPDEWNVIQSRCLVNYRMGKYDEAVADCTAALGYRPRLAGALYLRGLARLAKGDAAAATDLAAAKDADYRIEDRYALYGIKVP